MPKIPAKSRIINDLKSYQSFELFYNIFCVFLMYFLKKKTHFGYSGILPIDFATGNIQFLEEEVHSYRAIQRVCNFKGFTVKS